MSINYSPKRNRTPKIKENDIRNQILHWLQYQFPESKGYRWIVFNNIGIYSQKRQAYMKNPNTKKGVSDIIGWNREGSFIAIEVKIPTAKVNPEQQLFINDLNKTKNGFGMIARSLQDVQEAFGYE